MKPTGIIQFHIMELSPLRVRCMDSVMAAYPELPRMFYGPTNWRNLAEEIMQELDIREYPAAWNPDTCKGRPVLSDWFRYYWLWKHPTYMWCDSDLLILKRFDTWTLEGKPYFARICGGVIDSCWLFGNGCPDYFEQCLRRRRQKERYGILVNEFDGSRGHYIPHEHFKHYGCEHDAKEDPDPHWWNTKNI